MRRSGAVAEQFGEYDDAPALCQPQHLLRNVLSALPNEQGRAARGDHLLQRLLQVGGSGAEVLQNEAFLGQTLLLEAEERRRERDVDVCRSPTVAAR